MTDAPVPARCIIDQQPRAGLDRTAGSAPLGLNQRPGRPLQHCHRQETPGEGACMTAVTPTSRNSLSKKRASRGALIALVLVIAASGALFIMTRNVVSQNNGGTAEGTPVSYTHLTLPTILRV